MWQSPPFPNYGEPFIYSYNLFNERIEILSEEISSIFIKDTKNGKESSVRTLFGEGKYKDRLLSYKKKV